MIGVKAAEEPQSSVTILDQASSVANILATRYWSHYVRSRLEALCLSQAHTASGADLFDAREHEVNRSHRTNTPIDDRNATCQSRNAY